MPEGFYGVCRTARMDEDVLASGYLEQWKRRQGLPREVGLVGIEMQGFGEGIEGWQT